MTVSRSPDLEETPGCRSGNRIKVINAERHRRLSPDQPDRVPLKVVEDQSGGSLQSRIAGSEVYANPDGAQLQRHHTVIGGACRQEQQRIRLGRTELYQQIGGRLSVLSRHSQIAVTVERYCKINK